jgi:hypothetical protein
MAEKKAFVLRINPDVLKEIEAWGADEFRSTNGQIEYLLQQALRKEGAKKRIDLKSAYQKSKKPLKTSKICVFL